jgi:hypothetical protein
VLDPSHTASVKLKLERLANEALIIGHGGVSTVKILMWADDNGKELSRIVRAYMAQKAALERIAHPPFGFGFNKLRGLARSALANPDTSEPTGEGG